MVTLFDLPQGPVWEVAAIGLFFVVMAVLLPLYVRLVLRQHKK